MKNRHSPPPALTRPTRCAICGGAIRWDTAVVEGKRVDTFRCINGHSSEDGDVGVTGAAVRKRG